MNGVSGYMKSPLRKKRSSQKVASFYLEKILECLNKVFDMGEVIG